MEMMVTSPHGDINHVTHGDINHGIPWNPMETPTTEPHGDTNYGTPWR